MDNNKKLSNLNDIKIPNLLKKNSTDNNLNQDANNLNENTNLTEPVTETKNVTPQESSYTDPTESEIAPPTKEIVTTNLPSESIEITRNQEPSLSTLNSFNNLANSLVPPSATELSFNKLNDSQLEPIKDVEELSDNEVAPQKPVIDFNSIIKESTKEIPSDQSVSGESKTPEELPQENNLSKIPLQSETNLSDNNQLDSTPPQLPAEPLVDKPSIEADTSLPIQDNQTPPEIPNSSVNSEPLPYSEPTNVNSPVSTNENYQPSYSDPNTSATTSSAPNQIPATNQYNYSDGQYYNYDNYNNYPNYNNQPYYYDNNQFSDQSYNQYGQYQNYLPNQEYNNQYYYPEMPNNVYLDTNQYYNQNQGYGSYDYNNNYNYNNYYNNYPSYPDNYQEPPTFKVKVVKKKTGPVGFIINLISYAVLIILIIIGVLLTFYLLDIKIRQAKGDYTPAKYNAYVVLTGSMEPNINIKDVVITKKEDSKDLEIGDVITFKSSDARFGGITITHRIKEKYYDPATNEYSFTTQGDNNKVEDTALVEDENIYGTVILRIPKLGYIQEFLASKGGWVLVILLPCLAVLAYDIMKLTKMAGKKSSILR